MLIANSGKRTPRGTSPLASVPSASYEIFFAEFLSATPVPSYRRICLRRHGAELHFRDEGLGPALVFVHGWALSLTVWEPQARTSSQRIAWCAVIDADRAPADPRASPRTLPIRGLPGSPRHPHGNAGRQSQGARVALAAALEAASASMPWCSMAHRRMHSSWRATGHGHSARSLSAAIHRVRHRCRAARNRQVRAVWLALARSGGQDTVATLLDAYSALDLRVGRGSPAHAGADRALRCQC
jgi:hypothetical protein